jgi:hypothetical protein
MNDVEANKMMQVLVDKILPTIYNREELTLAVAM